MAALTVYPPRCEAHGNWTEGRLTSESGIFFHCHESMNSPSNQRKTVYWDGRPDKKGESAS